MGRQTRTVEHTDDEYWSLGEEWDIVPQVIGVQQEWSRFQDKAESRDKCPSFRAGGYKFHRVNVLIEACGECDFLRFNRGHTRVRECTCEREWRTMIQDAVHKQTHWPDFPELFNSEIEECEREWPGIDGDAPIMSFKRGRKLGHIHFGPYLICHDGPPASRTRSGSINRVADFLLRHRVTDTG